MPSIRSIVGVLSSAAGLAAATSLAEDGLAMTPRDTAVKPTTSQVYIRVEGESSTIFEGIAYHPFPREITTPSGGTHECDGTNGGANPNPGPTATTALDQVSKRPNRPFPYDGTFDSNNDDFFITSIGPDTQTATQFWGLLLNFQFSPTGGCKIEPPPNSHVLWAYDAFNKVYFLELTGPTAATVGQPFTVNVIDGNSGTPISGANFYTVDESGQTVESSTVCEDSDATGNAVCTLHKAGIHYLKANRADSLRSNRIVVNTAKAK